MISRTFLRRYLKLIPRRIIRRLPQVLVIFILLIFVYLLFFSRLSTPEKSKPIRPAPLPVSRNIPPPVVSAQNIFILDLNSNLVLWQRNADTRIYPASTTKMMTALVAVRQFPLSETIYINRSYPDGSHLGLIAGQTLTVEELLYAMLVQSANDAAEVLAENYPGGRNSFIQAMNLRVLELGLKNTHFQNPTGLDDNTQYSSASDLTRLARIFIGYPSLSRIAATENAIISSPDYSSSFVLSNINQLLGKVPGVMGIKTGFTDGAGQALVTLVNRGGHPVIITVIRSGDRFSDTKNLIEWVYSNFSWP